MNKKDINEGVKKFFTKDDTKGTILGMEDIDCRDDRYPMEEIEFDKKMADLKIRIFFRRLWHFPALVLNFIKNSLLGFVVKWGTIAVIVILVFLHLTDTYSSLYYKIHISLERSKNERIFQQVISGQKHLRSSTELLECYKNQFTRIAEEKQVDINFCKK